MVTIESTPALSNEPVELLVMNVPVTRLAKKSRKKPQGASQKSSFQYEEG